MVSNSPGPIVHLIALELLKLTAGGRNPISLVKVRQHKSDPMLASSIKLKFVVGKLLLLTFQVRSSTRLVPADFLLSGGVLCPKVCTTAYDEDMLGGRYDIRGII